MEFKDLIDKNFELKTIFNNIDKNLLNRKISGITNNSKKVKRNFLFIAIKGSLVDGNNYIKEAKKNGSNLILSSEVEGLNIITLPKVNLSIIYSLLSSVFYEKKPANIIAVTGTNGKTSVVEFCRQIWFLAGWKSASMGTLGTKISGENSYHSENENLTTYEPSILHKELYKNNIEVIPMKLRHARTLGGSFHCTTLDICRES